MSGLDFSPVKVPGSEKASGSKKACGYERASASLFLQPGYLNEGCSLAFGQHLSAGWQEISKAVRPSEGRGCKKKPLSITLCKKRPMSTLLAVDDVAKKPKIEIEEIGGDDDAIAKNEASEGNATSEEIHENEELEGTENGNNTVKATKDGENEAEEQMPMSGLLAMESKKPTLSMGNVVEMPKVEEKPKKVNPCMHVLVWSALSQRKHVVVQPKFLESKLSNF